MLITVFTPTYNRAHLLPRLYESLCRQSFRDFEWVIVDDGSVDDTKDVIDKLIIDNGQLSIVSNTADNEKLSIINCQLSIRYLYQKNGGKHRAINRGVKEAKGELFFIADSDDMLPDKALEIVAEQYKEIQNDHSFAGVVGFDAFSDGKMVAGSASFDVLECTEIEFRHKHRIIGDMKEVFRTDVLREIPFPEINGEKFCPEDLVWHRIAKKYKFRYFNQIIYIVEYLPTGLSAKLTKLRMDSPIASLIHYAEYNDFDLPIKQKVRNAINYWRFWYCIPSHKKQNRLIPHLYRAFIWAKPIGWLMHIHDFRVTR